MESFWTNVGGGIVSGLASGLVVAIAVLLAEYIIRKREKAREKAEALRIEFPNSKRLIQPDIFHKLGPGGSIELMKSVLGAADNTFIDSIPVFEENREEESGLLVHEFSDDEAKAKFEETRFNTTAYLYDFKNATVKITSKNEETIDSLALDVKFEYTLNCSDLPLGFVTTETGEGDLSLILGESKVDKDFAESSRLDHVFSRQDSYFICSIYTAGPLYLHYTCFGFPMGDVMPDKQKPETFVGQTITGICIHRDELECYIPRSWDSL